MVRCCAVLMWRWWPSSTSTLANIALDIISEWHDDWSSASVVNCNLVQDPSIRPPGFSLLRKQWCTLKHFRTNQGHCGACCKLCGLADSDLCECGATQTMSHIVESCLLKKLAGRLKKLHTADDESMDCPSYYGMNPWTLRVPAACNLHTTASRVWHKGSTNQPSESLYVDGKNVRQLLVINRAFGLCVMQAFRTPVLVVTIQQLDLFQRLHDPATVCIWIQTTNKRW